MVEKGKTWTSTNEQISWKDMNKSCQEDIRTHDHMISEFSSVSLESSESQNVKSEELQIERGGNKTHTAPT
ncbi:MAG: hypothetical protein CL912_13045 [Deltaproteobacteria bacterium]|nr:hypothetical protein [Deltaproteobacteria bacterium]